MGRSWLERVKTEAVVVHTADGRSIQGLLAEVWRDELVLVRAEYLSEEGPRPLLGKIGVPRENVAFVQWLNGSAAG